jgi:putative FmdB family regulatory protein
MPIYEYACKSCGHVFDALQKMAEDPLTDCPDCGEPELKKLLSAPNFRLKGSGWYETDFKKDNQRNLAGGPAKKDAKDAKDGKDSKTADKSGAAKESSSKSNNSATKTNGGKSAGAKSDD